MQKTQANGVLGKALTSGHAQPDLFLLLFFFFFLDEFERGVQHKDFPRERRSILN
jgi:hypothetical protein